MIDNLQLLALAGLGIVVLIAIAWTVGRLDAQARRGAWQRIADARRGLHERERFLVATLDAPRCDRCPLADRNGI